MVFAIVVSAAGVADMAAALDVAHAAILGGHEVGLFVMSEAVGELVARAGDLATLTEGGAQVWACATSVEAMAVSGPWADSGIALGSQDDHAALVHRADRVVAFT